MPGWIVVKVGGSLYDLPDLGERLTAWLETLDAGPILLVPGGGASADAVRQLDQVHRLGEESAHWLAIQALSLNARFLQTLLPGAGLMGSIADGAGSEGLHVLDAYPFFQADEAHAEHLPHTWEVTSDSLAVRAAALLGAGELVLLKSTDADGLGVVDSYFTKALRGVPGGLKVRLMNFRGASRIMSSFGDG